MVGLIFGILRCVKKNSYKQTETKWQKRKTRKESNNKKNSVLGSLLNDCASSQSDKFS